MKLTKAAIYAGIPALLGFCFVFAPNPAAGATEGFGRSREGVRLERIGPPAATASEALAYAAGSGAERLDHLKLAESQYQAAIAAHPGEKLFARTSEAKAGTGAAAAPLERVRAALASFRSGESALPPAAAPAAVRAAGGDGAMDNAAVIRMVREGEGGYAIMKAIKAAPEVAFDLSPEGLAQLSEAEVDPKIVGYMRQVSGQE